MPKFKVGDLVQWNKCQNFVGIIIRIENQKNKGCWYDVYWLKDDKTLSPILFQDLSLLSFPPET